MVDRFPTFTEQKNLFLLLVCSLSGGFSWKGKLASPLGPHCHLLALYVLPHQGTWWRLSQTAYSDESERINSIDSNLLTLNVWSNLESFISENSTLFLCGYSRLHLWLKSVAKDIWEFLQQQFFNSFMSTRHLNMEEYFQHFMPMWYWWKSFLLFDLFILTYTTRDNEAVFLLNTSGIWNYQ